jgi:hypothetical protein
VVGARGVRNGEPPAAGFFAERQTPEAMVFQTLNYF